MKNSKNQLKGKLGVSKKGKNKIKNNLLQQTINNGKYVFSGALHENPQPNVYNVDKNDFMKVVQHLTGLQSNSTKFESEITRLHKIRSPPLTNVRQLDLIQVRVPTLAAPQVFPYTELFRPPFHFVIGCPLVDMPLTNYIESPIITYMRNIQDSMINYDVSRGNQFQSYPIETEVFNNVNVQYQPQYYPIQRQVFNNVESFQASYTLHPNLVELPISVFMRRFQLFDCNSSKDNQFQY
ncbi:unnamed protein product [Lathyrus oleraceus]|uniref:VQ domain-containing protein n=2 Tax=Pisum sativum TaxID=3888 RepID=A0A9D4XI87_PEA|nr:hypothetical protein KIW84_043533 [Pisum sativum]